MENRNIISIAELLGADIRSRMRVQAIVAHLKPSEYNILDFKGVEFISRSFADELISCQEESGFKIDIIKTDENVDNMIAVVRQGRKEKKISTTAHNNVRPLLNMTDVSAFFNEYPG